MPVKKKNPGGRPTKLNDTVIQLMKFLYAEGKTDVQVSKAAGIDESTLHIWRKKNKLFFKSLKEGKKVADDKAEDCLYKRVTGYEYEEVVLERNSRDELVSRKTTKKQMAPDVTACIFWLKNRKPEQWRDKQLLDISLKDYLHPELKAVKTDDLKKILAERET